MELTQEQQAIISSKGNIKINAVAGSGKTTTVIEYAKTRPAHSKILYIAFNRSVKLEAEKKFKEKKLYNTKVETAHSLAFKYIVRKYGYQLRSNGYKTYEIADLLGLQGDGEKHAEYIVANHINKFISYFCNSDKMTVRELNYRDIVTDKKAKSFVNKFYKYIEKQTRILLSKMDKAEIDITHDFYLKKFQLAEIELGYDYILFDEGQDASAAMLDIFLKQKATKVIVGDTHQQIYGWRHAINSLEKTNFKTFHLSTSFRFTQPIANLAIEILNWKKHLTAIEPFKIIGKGNNTSLKSRAVLARTNLGLLLKAIEFITENKKLKNLYFEGNINSYTYADDGTSLYDVLNLYNGKRRLIRDQLIKKMSTIPDLEEYTEKTEDVQMGMMIEIVKEYGNEIPGIIQSIKDKHVDNDRKEEAEIIFSTVHRCKGMEYDSVHLVNDFITEEKLEKAANEKNPDIAKLNEEINLLYVAMTRTKNKLFIPQELIPEGFPTSEFIEPLIELEEEEVSKDSINLKNLKISNFEKIKSSNPAAYQPWTDALDEELTIMYCNGNKVKEMAVHFSRTRGAITARIRKLELEDLYGEK
jgi:superfamily I DNA/RNA helicase